jgi:diaminopimelate epimerase
MSRILNFHKMHGIGNDFIVVHEGFGPGDNVHLDAGKAVALCNRRIGIGADGVLIIGPSKTADFKVTIYNSDGSTAEMCGNGIRCCARYVQLAGLSARQSTVFETGAGPVSVESLGNDRFRACMGAPILAAEKIPTRQTSGRVLMHELSLDRETISLTAVSMGNPHAVIFADDLTDNFVLRLGPSIERHPFFPRKTNVEFVNVLANNEIRMRVWERGCGETLACGTGACAAVVAGFLVGQTGSEVSAHLPGGDLFVEWDGGEASPVYLTGPAVVSFRGSVDLAP